MSVMQGMMKVWLIKITWKLLAVWQGLIIFMSEMFNKYWQVDRTTRLENDTTQPEFIHLILAVWYKS